MAQPQHTHSSLLLPLLLLLFSILFPLFFKREFFCIPYINNGYNPTFLKNLLVPSVGLHRGEFHTAEQMKFVLDID